jgi:hypothetical protein
MLKVINSVSVLMQIVPLEAAHLFYLNADILGWLLAVVQPKKQHLRHNVL